MRQRQARLLLLRNVVQSSRGWVPVWLSPEGEAVTVPPLEYAVPRCQDCGEVDFPLLVVADLGQGAFLALLCDTCWHRRQYRAKLLKRRGK